MYLDELNTVRFDARNKNYENNFIFAQAAMMKNIIQGQKITLSQTQLFDSDIILKLLKDEPGFVKLFEKLQSITDLRLLPKKQQMLTMQRL